MPLKVSEIARFERVTPEAVRSWIHTGRLPAYRVGGHWRVLPEHYAHFQRTDRRPPQPPEVRDAALIAAARAAKRGN